MRIAEELFMFGRGLVPYRCRDTSNCVDRMIKVAQEAKAPFTMEVVKSIASLCREDPYKLWRRIASEAQQRAVPVASRVEGTGVAEARPQAGSPCWRCTACSKIFNDVKHLVNHITFFVRQRDKAHANLYKTIKEAADRSGKTFTQVAEEMLRC